MGVTATVDVPATVASVVIAGADSEKSWTVTDTLVVRESVLGAVPVVPVTTPLNGATPVVQLTERTAPLNEAVQPAGTVPAVKVTVPLKPLTGVTVTVVVPATVASVLIAGADSEKSWMVTGTTTEPVAAPLVPVTVTLNVATPVEHVTDRPVVCAGGMVTLGAIVAVQPAGAPDADRFTVPEKLPTGVIVIVEVPATVANVVIEVGLADTVNPESTTGTLTVRDNVLGAVPVVPVTVTVNVLLGSGLQLTDRTFVAEIVSVQPVGGVLVTASETVPEKPLMLVTEIVEVPAVPGVLRTIVDGAADSEKSWTVTLTVVVRDSVLGAVPVVPVTTTLNGATPVAQVTERMAPENDAVHPAGTVPAVKVTVPAKPLIGVTVTVEVPAKVASVVIAGADNEKS
jgi:hypothetical protein